MNTLDLRAEIADLEARVAKLETYVCGESGTTHDHSGLLRIYVESNKKFESSEASAHLWAQVIKGLGVAEMLTLARYVRDPFPWKPLLLLLDRLKIEGYPVDSAIKHLESVAKGLLAAQGMSVVQVDDVMQKSTHSQDAIYAISSQMGM